MRLYFLIIASVFTFCICSCSRNEAPSDPSFTVDNRWECVIDGVLYKGSVDTSYYKVTDPASPGPDSFILVTGTSDDKKANIAFRIVMDRSLVFPGYTGIFTNRSYFCIDAISDDNPQTNSFQTLDFSVEGFTPQKFKAGFSGVLATLNGTTQNITNGKISFDIGRSNGNAKIATFDLNNPYIQSGHSEDFIRSAVFKDGTLTIDCFSFEGESTWLLKVRTGASIKPGLYKSTDGDVGFTTWIPSIVTHYVSDSIGNLSVNILSVEGNIVTASIYGIVPHYDGTTATAQMVNGYFKCRVKDYYAGTDGANTWRFNMDNRGQEPFYAVSGNIQSAQIIDNGGFHSLVISGNTNTSNSLFRIKIKYFNPNSPGIYELESFRDSCYFSSTPEKYFNSNDAFYVKIDTINTTRVTGSFYGYMLLGVDLNGGGFFYGCRKGYFKADF